MSNEEIIALLGDRLDGYRFKHSLCVADEAKRLAIKYGVNEEKAYLAGLLHDITKNADKTEHLNIFTKFGIILNDVEKASSKLWHAISGAWYVKGILNIDDEEIFDAIRYHTTAKANQSLFGKILYIADFTSSDRTYDDVDILRGIADRSLEEAYIYALSYTVNELVEKGCAVHIDTVSAYNSAVLEKEKFN